MSLFISSYMQSYRCFSAVFACLTGKSEEFCGIKNTPIGYKPYLEEPTVETFLAIKV